LKRILRSPGIWIVIIICVLIITLYLCGFRITYNPVLDNSWDAISATASWFGAIISLFALVVAIRIPAVIAEQQNKIALFERRSDVYSKLVTIFYDTPLMHTAFINEHDKRHNVKQSFPHYNLYTKRKADEALFTEVSFLFPYEIKAKIDRIRIMRAKFFDIEDKIEEGITYLSDEDFEFMFTQYADMLISASADIEKIKQIAEKSVFTKSGEPVDNNGYPIIYNLYDLGNEQDAVAKEINLLQDELIEDIIKEISICEIK
jgi:hypothetical protein